MVSTASPCTWYHELRRTGEPEFLFDHCFYHLCSAACLLRSGACHSRHSAGGHQLLTLCNMGIMCSKHSHFTPTRSVSFLLGAAEGCRARGHGSSAARGTIGETSLPILHPLRLICLQVAAGQWEDASFAGTRMMYPSPEVWCHALVLATDMHLNTGGGSER